jgi:hypothetical protein
VSEEPPQAKLRLKQGRVTAISLALFVVEDDEQTGRLAAALTKTLAPGRTAPKAFEHVYVPGPPPVRIERDEGSRIAVFIGEGVSD